MIYDCFPMSACMLYRERVVRAKPRVLHCFLRISPYIDDLQLSDQNAQDDVLGAF